LCNSMLSLPGTGSVCLARDFTPSSRHSSSSWRSRGLTFGGWDIPLHSSEPELAWGMTPLWGNLYLLLFSEPHMLKTHKNLIFLKRPKYLFAFLN
jgi:hypothetical protein